MAISTTTEFIIAPFCLLISAGVGCLIVWWIERSTEEGHDAVADARRRRGTRWWPRPRPAPAPARVAAVEPQQQLVYFSYPAGTGAEGGRGGTAGASVVVCAICLEALVGGAECSVVPACLHVFHRSCVALWMKSQSTCPLCRRPIAPGSQPLSTADAMV